MERLPPIQALPFAWIGSVLSEQPDQWLGYLTGQEIGELEAAARLCLSRGMPIANIDAAAFVLPNLGPRLARLQDQLLRGIGFGLLRGLPVADYDREMAAAIFFGIGAHMGYARSQNGQGHLLGHVRDIGADAGDINTRIYQTSERQSFHTDSCDVVGLLCLKEAAEGGVSLVVSAITIFNEMQRLRPDLLPLLFEPIATDRRGEVDDGQKPYFQIPVFNWHDGKLTSIYQRQYIDSAQRFDDAPRLTERHVEALDFYDDLANDRTLHLSMRLCVGDMQFVYNHALLHDRTGFRDHVEPNNRRHLLRLWLSCPGDRTLPDCFSERFGSTVIGDRGGVLVPGTRLHVPID